MKYAVVVEEGKTSFGAHVPDLPGCVAAGETRDEVLTLIEEAIEFHLAGLKEDGQPIPEPSSSIQYVGVHGTYNILGDASGQWGWNLVAANGRIIATSAERYQTRAECLEAIELVKSLSIAPVKAA
jgi:predicted RNase H-like HicB family nuclease/uncharacterized protein YegP (UPF0339 family)